MIHLYAGARHLYGKAGMKLIGIGQLRLPLIAYTVILLTFQGKKKHCPDWYKDSVVHID